MSPAPLCIVTELPQNGARSFQITYSFPFGIQITEELALYDKYNAARVLLHFENVSDENSGTLSKIQDCDITLPFNEHFVHPKPGHCFTPPDKARASVLTAPTGRDEFAEYPEYIAPENILNTPVNTGAPPRDFCRFLRLTKTTGVFSLPSADGAVEHILCGPRREINIQSGIEDTEFYLKPGENPHLLHRHHALCQRTEKASNQWRRFKEYISPWAKHSALPKALWPPVRGASLSSERMAEVLKTSGKDIGAEYYWIDAGWYGYSTGPCPTEFDGDWPRHTGSWVVNKTYHPDGLRK